MESTITEGVLFHSPALGETRWTARSLEGVDALNQEYSFRVRLDLAAGTLTQEELERVLEAPATLFFIEGELELNRFSGVVKSLTSRPDLDRKRTELNLTVVPRVALAAHRRGSVAGLTRAQLKALDAYWEARMFDEPSLRAEWKTFADARKAELSK